MILTIIAENETLKEQFSNKLPFSLWKHGENSNILGNSNFKPTLVFTKILDTNLAPSFGFSDVIRSQQNRPFSRCLSFLSKRVFIPNYSRNNVFHLHVHIHIKKAHSVLHEAFHAITRFETEAISNSEMTYLK